MIKDHKLRLTTLNVSMRMFDLFDELITFYIDFLFHLLLNLIFQIEVTLDEVENKIQHVSHFCKNITTFL